jgi:hypothetical protein
MATSIKQVTGNVDWKVKDAHTKFVMMKRPTVYVEGMSDSKFFKKLFDRRAHIDVTGDKKQVLDVMNRYDFLIRDRGWKHFAVAIVDLDYDRIMGDDINDNPRLVYIDAYDRQGPSRDLEVMLVRSTALHGVLCEFQLEDRYDFIRSRLISQGAIIGAAHIVKESLNEWDWRRIGSLQDLCFPTFFCQHDITIDLEKFVDHVFRPIFSATRANEYFTALVQEVIMQHQDSELCRGHDLIKMLALYVSSKGPNVRPQQIESQLRLAYDAHTFWSGELGMRLQTHFNWNNSE